MKFSGNVVIGTLKTSSLDFGHVPNSSREPDIALNDHWQGVVTSLTEDCCLWSFSSFM